MAESNFIKNQLPAPTPPNTRIVSSARIHGLVLSSTQNGDPHREKSLQKLNVNVETPRLPPRPLSLLLFSHRKLPSL